MNIVEQENEAVLSCGSLHHCAHPRAEERGMSSILHKHYLGRVSRQYERRTARDPKISA